MSAQFDTKRKCGRKLSFSCVLIGLVLSMSVSALSQTEMAVLPNPETFAVADVKLNLTQAKTFTQAGVSFPVIGPLARSPWFENSRPLMVANQYRVIEWLTVDVSRNSWSERLAEFTALLLDDGRLANMDGTTPLRIPDVPSGDYLLQVRQRAYSTVVTRLVVTALDPIEAAPDDVSSSLGAGMSN